MHGCLNITKTQPNVRAPRCTVNRGFPGGERRCDLGNSLDISLQTVSHKELLIFAEGMDRNTFHVR